MRKEVDKKLEEGQFGFRAGKGTLDALYIYIASSVPFPALKPNRLSSNFIYIHTKLCCKPGNIEKKRKIVAFFVDLKMAFDRIDSVKLREMLMKAGMREQLRRRITETYKETKNVIRVKNKKSEDFGQKVVSDKNVS